MGILYKLVFDSGKIYIGVTEADTLDQRFAQHKSKSKTKSNLPIYSAWKKYGAPTVFIIGYFYGDELYQAEINAIKDNNTVAPHGYNILSGGQKSPSLNLSVKKKIAFAQKKRYEDPIEREKASERMKNASKETRQKISLSLTGKKLSQETKEKIRLANIGKKHNNETKEKMSQSHKGKKYSEETIQKMREAAKKRMQTPEAKMQLKMASLSGGNSMKEKAKKRPLQ